MSQSLSWPARFYVWCFDAAALADAVLVIRPTCPRRATAAVLSAVVALLPLHGCATEQANSAVTVTDSSGVSMVVNRRPQWGAADGWRLDSAPETVVYTDERSGGEPFTYITSARLLSDGRVVLTTERAEICAYSANGQLERRWSRSGDGPGELRDVSSMHRAAGDTVIVASNMGFRVLTFDARGTLVRDERPDRARIAALGRWAECYSRYQADGSRISCQHDNTIPATATNRPSRMIARGFTSPGPGLLRQLRRTWIMTPTLDSAFPLGIEAGIEQYGVKRGTGEYFLSHPHYSRSIVTAGGSPLRVAIMRNPEYRVELWSSRGRLEHVISRTHARRAPTAAERAYARDQLRRREGSRIGAQELAQMLAQLPEPDSLPAASDVQLLSSGNLLVRRFAGLSTDSAAVDVFSDTGRWLGTMTLPPRSYILDVVGSRVLLLRMDVDDVMSLEVHRVLGIDRPAR